MISSKTFYLAVNSILLIILYHYILFTHNIKTDYAVLEDDNKNLKEKLVWDNELRNKLSEIKVQFDGIGGYIEAAKENIDSGNFDDIDGKIGSLPKEYLETIFAERIIKHGLKLYHWVYSDFGYPVYYPDKSYVSSEYFNLRKYNGSLVYHQAIDIVATNDHRIIAAADGKIADTGYNDILGKYIVIRHNINKEYYLSEYGHAALIYVREGQKVKKGEVIGLIGLSGNTSGYHLHFALKKFYFPNRRYFSVNMVATSSWGLKIK